MARFSSPVAFLATAALLTLAPAHIVAQRPALAGEKARVADAVKRDLARLATMQRANLSRSKTFASDIKDLHFVPSSGADISIAFASATAWAANATHATLSPVKCFVIISASDAVDAPTSQPFCTDAEPGTAAGRVAATSASRPTDPPVTAPASKSPPRVSAPTTAAPTTAAPAKAAPSVPTRSPARTNVAAPRRTAAPTERAATPAVVERAAPAVATPATSAPSRAGNAAVRMITRDAGDGATLADRVEAVSSSEFASVLTAMARQAVAVMDAPPPEIIRDPYESTPEYDARVVAAAAEYLRREQDYFRATKRSFVVQMPVRAVRYDPDRETIEFSVEALRIPSAREGRSQLTIACFTRPVFWCMPDAGMTYDASDLWKVPRATARQFDVLRTPLMLTARFTVGGRPDGERALAISLIDMELQARGQTVQRWTGR